METYVIHVTKECNCDCHYCYEKDKTSTYTWDEIKELIDNIVKNRTSDEFTIEFLGGEPMLAWDHIRNSYEYMESIEGINVVHYTITNNGTILTDEQLDYLSKNHKMTYGISMDGHKWANQLRFFKDSRKNTYETVIANAQKLNEYRVGFYIHMVAHLYNVAYIHDSIVDLYENGVKRIDVGIIETTMKIDEEYADRFISEMKWISDEMVAGKYPGLSIGLFNSLKSEDDIRSYILDPETGKTIGETYGRSGDDITHKDLYKVNRCTSEDEVSKLIKHIRRTVYEYHQENIRK